MTSLGARISADYGLDDTAAAQLAERIQRIAPGEGFPSPGESAASGDFSLEMQRTAAQTEDDWPQPREDSAGIMPEGIAAAADLYRDSADELAALCRRAARLCPDVARWGEEVC